MTSLSQPTSVPCTSKDDVNNAVCTAIDVPDQLQTQSRTQLSLAMNTLNNNGIVLVPEMGAFMVKGSKNDKYSVTLFPNEKCNCPSTTRCYHIIAAMLAIGMPIPNEKKKYNLSQLRRNARSKQNKKCGTKKGRKGDRDIEVEIIPAPDSAVKNRSLASAETPASKNNTLENVGYIPNTAKKSLFLESTPKSILKKRDEPKCQTLKSEKKRKLTFHDNLEKQLEKIPKIDIESNIGDDLLELSRPVNIESQYDNGGIDLDVFEDKNNLESNIERNSSIGSDTNSVDEFIELNSSRDETEVEEIFFWKKHLGLNEQDKNDILNNKKLNSHHMEAVCILLRRQFNRINGLQLTEQVPAIAAENANRWVTQVPYNSVIEPACQIHHTHRDHWVSTILFNKKIHFLDSLGIERLDDAIIPDGLKIQLSYIYMDGKRNKFVLKYPRSCVKIIIPTVGYLQLHLLLHFVFVTSFV